MPCVLSSVSVAMGPLYVHGNTEENNHKHRGGSGKDPERAGVSPMSSKFLEVNIEISPVNCFVVRLCQTTFHEIIGPRFYPYIVPSVPTSTGI